MTGIYTYYTQSPIAWVEIIAENEFIISIAMLKEGSVIPTQKPVHKQTALLQQCVAQLDEYFAGTRKVFTIPVKQAGTDFQQKVWAHLVQIPYGTNISYGELAKRLGDDKLTRAVGAANGKNKLWIVIPCHRVIGANGSLTGYAGGIDCKRWLLQHEARYTKHNGKLF